MIDKLSAINGQHIVNEPGKRESQSRMKDNAVETREGKVQNIRDNKLAGDYKRVAQEMESLFAYQLIKVMRQSAGALSSDNKSMGNDTYMGLFDMELSKLFAQRGLGLQDAIVQWLNRSQK